MILPADSLRRAIRAALERSYPDHADIEIAVELTTDAKFGDYTTNVAMRLAPLVKQPAIEVAQHLVSKLVANTILEKAIVAGPGFINFTLKPAWLMKYSAGILADKHFGENTAGHNQRVIVEFVSANPTGPVTLGNGRAAFAGDALSKVLTMSGWRVVREYYINDIGNQVNILAESVLRRYWQHHGIPTEYPDYCYQGEYVAEVAQKLKIERLKLQDMMTLRDRIKDRIINIMIRDHARVMKKLGVRYDSWFRESTLYVRKTDVKIFDLLRRHDLLFEKDGATWFRTTAFGDDKDRVLIKNDGTKTYFVSDIALRWNRFGIRGFDQEVLFLGADHHGYIGRLQAAAAALGFARKITVNIVQLVRMIRGGHEVKMSKRAGNFVTLEELIEEVGVDVARFFFLMHGANTHMDFNIDAAKEKSEQNPVYYVQYAHARMSSIIKKIKRLPVIKSKSEPQSSEITLVKRLLEFPTVVAQVAATHETQQLPFFALDLARTFHEFYTQCRVIDDGKVWGHRLQLVKATQIVLAKTLGLMGISAPEKM